MSRAGHCRQEDPGWTGSSCIHFATCAVSEHQYVIMGPPKGSQPVHSKKKGEGNLPLPLRGASSFLSHKNSPIHCQYHRAFLWLEWHNKETALTRKFAQLVSSDREGPGPQVERKGQRVCPGSGAARDGSAFSSWTAGATEQLQTAQI